MEENKEITKENKLKAFFYDVLRGIGIGVAFIIPGFSGGSVAAILGIYERIINAIAGIFTSFKKSFITILPIAIGLAIGAISLLFPIKWAIGAFPFPTVSLFVGLTLGCLPSMLKRVKGKITLPAVAALAIPAILTVLLSFLPIGNDVNLSSLNLGGYVILFFVGIIGSSALVIPGISGSMLLLMLGYYNPIVGMITDLLSSVKNILLGTGIADGFLGTFLVLLSLALGIAVGFVGISMIMKILFSRYNRGTYLAIIGFILGSLPTVYVSTYKDAGFTAQALPRPLLYFAACAVMLALGTGISLLVSSYATKTKNK